MKGSVHRTGLISLGSAVRIRLSLPKNIMIITKTPYRISFFGGGSDYPSWYKKFGGKVLSATIDKNLYISCRHLPEFFKHKYRIVWSKVEETKNINQIKHNAVRKILQYYKNNTGLEIHYDGDLPARSGMGSSSSFVVGLVKALNDLKNIKITKRELATKSIFLEQKILKEAVGSQDQIAASYGGLNKIIFNKNNTFNVKKINTKNTQKLSDNLVLIYTGIKRTAHFIAKTFINKLENEKYQEINKIVSFVGEAEKILNSNNLDDFGLLLNESWKYKKMLSNKITNHKIDDLYKTCLDKGALGGKLLGAGGGGFLLLYVRKNEKRKFIKGIKNVIEIPFEFSNNGCQTIFRRD